MKKIILLLACFFITACADPIQEKLNFHKKLLVQSQTEMMEIDKKYNGKIIDTLQKANDESLATNEYPTEEEIKYISIGMQHIKNTILKARTNILNYPLEASFTKAYKRLSLLRDRKITFAQAAIMAKGDQQANMNASNRARNQVLSERAAQRKAEIESLQQSIHRTGQGLGKTQRQIQLQEEYQKKNIRTTCRRYGYTVTCDSY